MVQNCSARLIEVSDTSWCLDILDKHHVDLPRNSWGTLEDIDKRLSWRQRGCGRKIFDDAKQREQNLQLHYCITKPLRNASTIQSDRQWCTEIAHMENVHPGLAWGKVIGSGARRSPA